MITSSEASGIESAYAKRYATENDKKRRSACEKCTSHLLTKAHVHRQLRRGGFGEAKLEQPISGNEYAKLGARVKLINLHAHTELNEKEGTIKEFYRNGRIGVQVSHPLSSPPFPLSLRVSPSLSPPSFSLSVSLDFFLARAHESALARWLARARSHTTTTCLKTYPATTHCMCS